MTALIRTAADIVEAYRRRIAELGIAHSTVDAISGLPDGYTSKLLAPTPMKTMSRAAIELLNGALAMGFIVAVDDEQARRVQARWLPRKRPIRAMRSITGSIVTETHEIVDVSPDLQRLLQRSEFMRAIGLRGNIARKAKLSRWKRSVIARRAAKARWSKTAGTLLAP